MTVTGFPIFLLAVLLCPTVAAAEITVGGTKLLIPAPSGYAEVTGEMKPFADLQKQTVVASNVQFAYFLPEDETAVAASGKIPAAQRSFCVQTAKDLEHRLATRQEFGDIKRATQTQNESFMRKVEQQFPGVLEQVNKGLSQSSQADMALSLNQVLALPPHRDTDRVLSFSMRIRMTTEAKGAKTLYEGVATASFVHVRGKVLFLYVNGPKLDLEWTRSVSETWADAIVQENPSSGDVAKGENVVRRSGIDWEEVANHGLIGGVIGIGAMLVLLVVKKIRG